MRIDESNSPLFQRSETYRPFKYPWAFDMYREHEKVHWTAEEIELSEDKYHWTTVADADTKAFIKGILVIFTEGDKEVSATYNDEFIPTFKNNEVRMMLNSIANREGTHQEAYSLVNDTFGFDEDIFGEFRKYKEALERLEYMADFNTRNTVAAKLENLAHTVVNEGVALFGVFACLLNFSRKGLFPGFSLINLYSLREESMHVEAAVALFRTIADEHPGVITDHLKRTIYSLVRKAVELEEAFLKFAFATYKLDGIDLESTIRYIKFVADRRLIQLGLKANYGIEENPFEWIETLLSGVQHQSFFETRVSEYQVANAMVGEIDWDSQFSNSNQV